MDEDDKKDPAPADMGTVTLMLGLYLIILAFFILLNAISEFVTEKVEQVSQSVGEGFGFEMDGKARMRDDVEGAMAPVFKLLAQEIQSVMESYISVKDFRFTQEDGIMRLTIETSAFFEEGAIKIRPEQAEFFTDVAKLVEKPRLGLDMECDIMVTATEDEAQTTPMDAMELAGRRASIFARALINKGVNDDHVTTAALDAEKGQILLSFFVRVHNSMAAIQEARAALGLDAPADKNQLMPGPAPEQGPLPTPQPGPQPAVGQ